MFTEDDYKQIILDSLYNSDVIDKDLYLKCGKPKYISGLPGDLRTTDENELYDRLTAIEDELNRREEILKKAEYRVGVKTRDSERLGKRVEKTMATMDKAIDNINKESDKVVKDIDKLSEKIDKIDFEGNSALKDKIDNGLKRLKDAHNSFFDEDLTGDNLTTYRTLAERYSKAGENLNSIMKDAFDNKLINKTDLNRSDISKNIARINKNIDNFEKNGKKITDDVQKVSDNQNDIDYIVTQSNTVSKEMDILMDEFEKTNNKYMENSKAPRKVLTSNPQMIINLGSKDGDNFTLLPSNYESYIV